MKCKLKMNESWNSKQDLLIVSGHSCSSLASLLRFLPACLKGETVANVWTQSCGSEDEIILVPRCIMTGTSLSCIRLLGLVFWNLIHLEVASDSFCFLWNCSWLLVFILYVFFMIFSGFNLYCWNGIHFS